MVIIEPGQWLTTLSVVFRTMLTDLRSDSSTPVIPLVDPDIEKYHSVKALLDLIHHGTIPDSLLKNLSRLSHLAKLTMKFDCSLVQGILRMRMQNSLAQEPGWSYIIFIVAAQLDDAAICRAAIPVAGRLIWLGEATKPIPFSDESIKGASVLDLAAMKDSEFEAIPFKYSRALARASRTDGPNGKKDWDVIADEFYRQVTRQGKGHRRHLCDSMHG